MPKKVRTFLWLVLHKDLPVNANRLQCHLATSGDCNRCSSAEEDCLHCLRDCPYSHELWCKLSAWAWQNFLVDDLHVWVKRHATGRNAVRFLSGIWGAWKWRKYMTLDPNPWTLQVAWNEICHYHDDFVRFCNSAAAGADPEFMEKHWSPPPLGWMKLNTDGSFRKDNRSMGGGGLILDSTSQWHGGFTWHGRGGDAFLAEAKALHEGLQYAWNQGHRMVICEVDCKELFSVLSSSSDWQVHVHALILGAIREMLSRSWQMKLAWIGREINTSADWIAKEIGRAHV